MLTPVPTARVRLYADRAEWLSSRTATVGASEVAAILGCSPYAGPWDVLARRLHPRDEDSPDKARGREWEQWVLYLYAKQTGLHVCAPGAPWDHEGPVTVVHDEGESDVQVLAAKEQRRAQDLRQDAQVIEGRGTLRETGRTGDRGAVSGPGVERRGDGAGRVDVAHQRHHEGPGHDDDRGLGAAQGLAWATCSPDAWAYGAEGWGLVEVKTSVKPADWGEPGVYRPDEAAGHVPPNYLLQVAWALEVTGLPWCDLVAMMPWYDLRVYRIYADAEYQADLLAQVGEWRERHLVRGEPLPVDGSAACRRVVEREPRDPGREATPEEWAAMQIWAQARAQVEHWSEVAATAQNHLLRSMGPAERIYTPDGWRIVRANGMRLLPPKETK